MNPTASPNDIEKAHHYLWRFWRAMPKDGHVAIFDRTWYGRVMVERIEGFCTTEEWKRAYKEINDMEKDLYDAGRHCDQIPGCTSTKTNRNAGLKNVRKIRRNSGRSRMKTGETVKNGISMRMR